MIARRPPGDLGGYHKNMLWPFILPLKITFWSLAVIVGLLTAFAPAVRWKRGRTFTWASIVALVVFIPLCVGIMAVIDAKRFGVFQHATFDDVDDWRVERYLPPQATNITLDKYPTGFRAKYHISEPELLGYLDELWEKYGDLSVIGRDETLRESAVSEEEFADQYGELGWEPLENAAEYSSPLKDNGAGFTVWYDADVGIAYHRAGYW